MSATSSPTRSGLGDVLSSLAGTAEKRGHPANRRSAQDDTALKGAKSVSIDALTPGQYQPRQAFEQSKLESIAATIRDNGVLQPLLVRPVRGGLEIVAGERRWRASKLAGLTEVPVIVKELTDKETATISLTENLQREDLNVVEEARAMQRLYTEFGQSDQEIAASLGVARSSVTNKRRLLDLHVSVIDLLDTSTLTMGSARPLLALDSDQQYALALEIVAKNLSSRQAEELVTKHRTGTQAPKSAKQRDETNPAVPEILKHLGAGVQLKKTSAGYNLIFKGITEELKTALMKTAEAHVREDKHMKN